MTNEQTNHQTNLPDAGIPSILSADRTFLFFAFPSVSVGVFLFLPRFVVPVKPGPENPVRLKPVGVNPGLVNPGPVKPGRFSTTAQ